MKASQNILLFLECMSLLIYGSSCSKAELFICFYSSKYIDDNDRGNTCSLTCMQICAIDFFHAFTWKNSYAEVMKMFLPYLSLSFVLWVVVDLSNELLSWILGS